MMDEEQEVDEEHGNEEEASEGQEVTVDLGAMSEESRREFLGKFLAGAGGLALGGLLASALGAPAEAAPFPNRAPGAGQLPLRFHQIRNGVQFTATSTSPELSKMMQHEGLIPAGQPIRPELVTLVYRRG